MSTEALKPCPFCGSHAQTDFIEGESYIIECYACDARTGHQDSAEDAINAWNGRAEKEAPDSSHVIPPTRGTGSQLVIDRAALSKVVTDLIMDGARARSESFRDGVSFGVIGLHHKTLELAGVQPGIAGAAKGGNTNSGFLQKFASERYGKPIASGSAPAAGTDQDAERYRHIRDTANNGYALSGPAGIGKWQVSRKMCGGEGEFFFGLRLDAMIDSDIASIAHTNAGKEPGTELNKADQRPCDEGNSA